MKFNEYRKLVTRTMNVGLDMEEQLTNYCLGIVGESGEVCDYLKKVLYHKHVVDKVKLKKELGDVMWYACAISELLHITVSELDNVDISVYQTAVQDHSCGLDLSTNKAASRYSLMMANDVSRSVELLYRDLFEDVDLDMDEFSERFGYIFCSMALLCDALTISLDEVAVLNIEKLKARYPDGFDIEKSIHRKEGDI